MKGMEGRAVRGPLYKQLDLERKHAKQAEARLGRHLQRLEQTHLYRLRLLAWEQRQLHRDLQRLQQDIKKKHPSYFGNGIQKRPGHIPECPSQGGKHGIPPATRVRALATNTTQKVHKTGFQVPPSDHTGLQDPVRSKEQLLSQSCATSHLTEEKPPDEAMPTGPADLPAGSHGVAHCEEVRSEDTGLQLDLRGGGHMSLGPTECVGNLNRESSVPSFLELFAKAANAHYLRHRVPPESERMLSIGEIFGHGDPSTQSRVASKSPPL
ncbi:PREDICTED: coiled-coil domain-containing protein 190 [Miniopterus natalensis]|uniref:coiled-coil domain-containing protein 190 n=1 Tax=Miniopterus natalensis TaxID=291302 RepID=UPI0007A6DDB3|nr:PREDICTED: coiled-coil domain-containing protein 190 [Miniopterus natalensis]XP_016065934.1 PREDICTED: coiled-coil domain-containing protein 190 [Miniopterus natalensis]